MWGTILVGILARPWARWAAGVALAALTRVACDHCACRY